MKSFKSIFSLNYWKKKNELLYHSDVFCMAPWVHQYLLPDGRIYPCCLSAQELDENLGDLSKGEILSEIWNNEATTTLRLNMLNGKKSKVCSGCYKYENLGRVSSRKDFNEMFSQHFDLVLPSINSGKLQDYNLKSIDFRFSNICNLKCRTCSHLFSSKWFEESKIIGCGTFGEKSIIYPVSDPDALWNQVKEGLDGLERIHFAGGEPLMMEEHYKILEYLISKKKVNVQITYNTNFADFKCRNYDVVSLWKSFKHVSVLASLDGMGERGEYIRKGINWKKVEENRIRLMKEVPHVQFMITPTVSIMNVMHLIDFYENWLERGLIKPTEINVYVLFEPYFYNIVNLPIEFKKKVEKTYRLFFEKNKVRFSKRESDYVNGQFDIVLNQMKQKAEDMPKDYYNGHDFNSYNNILDHTRNESFYHVFPELVGIV